MRLRFERDLAASPAAAWPFLTDPERMNRWSRARVSAVAPGDGGDPAGVGALRSVALRLPGRTIDLEEVIEESEPPERLVYRVVGGAPVKRHRGVVALAPRPGGGARLLWEVEVELARAFVEPIARRLLARQLETSLDALCEVVRGAGDGRLPPRRAPIDESAEVPALEAAAGRCAARQREIADELAARGDPKRWFPRVYQYVTEGQLEGCRAGTFAHPGWVLRLVPAFHAYYEDNLERALGRTPGFVEAHWRSSFRAMDEGARWFGDEIRGALYGVAKGMQAHIEEDLPRALAEVHARHYAARCDYARFRADYLRMGWVFERAGERLTADIPARALRLRTRILRAILPAEVAGWMLNRSFYDLPRERRRAFERGGRIAAMLLRGGH